MQRPAPGTKVTVVVRNLMAYKPVYIPFLDMYSPKSNETETYTGTVLKSDPWMRTDEFNMTSDLPHFPVRTINMRHVVSLNGAEQGEQPAMDNIKTKIVKGSKDNEYVVVLRNGVAETCTCPAFRFRGGRCKHLAVASEK